MFQSLRERWQRQSPTGRSLLLLLAALLIGVAVYFALQAGQRRHDVLFSDLDPQDAATIVAELERMKVPYRLGHDEGTILVDAEQVHAVRLKLMGKGVNLRGGVGFEIFNDSDFGVTEFAQKINYQRALQGELARTIMSLQAVDQARVHLVLPESSLFRKAGQKPKAAVTVSLREGGALQPDQVLGIQRLVAASVPQVEAGAVTVIDQRGVTLSRAADAEGDDAMAGLGSKHEVESYLRGKVVAVLDKTFGPGNAIVTVDVTINHDQVRTTREEVLPFAPDSSTRAIVRSRSTAQSQGAAEATAAAATPAAAGTAGARSGSNTAEIEYQNGRVVEQVVSRPGTLQRVSVGVMLPSALPAPKLAELKQVLAMAVGLNRDRGDEIAISSLDQFGVVAAPTAAVVPAAVEAAAARPPAAAAPAQGARTSVEVWPVLAVLLALVAIGAVLWSWRQRRHAARLSESERERLLLQMRQWLSSART